MLGDEVVRETRLCARAFVFEKSSRMAESDLPLHERKLIIH
jgi:hypothetical protein